MNSTTSNPKTEITRWLLDTRSIWPGDKITDSASTYLSLVSQAEQNAIIRKYHIADARMSLASALLKRAYIHKCTGLSWPKIDFERKGHPVHGKPVWKHPDAEYSGQPWPKIDFNVSHQAGLVMLVGSYSLQKITPAKSTWEGDITSNVQSEEEEVIVGCDIVCPNERQDLEIIRETNFEDWTSTFNEVLSDEELWDITYNLPSHSLTLLNGESVSSNVLGRLDRVILCDQDVELEFDDGRLEKFSSDLIVEAKLRRFYTFYALKEAYIKLVGEGLLAPWIKKCEFRNVKAPKPGTVARCSTNGVWGGRIIGGVHSGHDTVHAHRQSNGVPGSEDQLEIWFDNEEVMDVRTEVQAFEDNFIIATMIRPASILGLDGFPLWHRVDLEHDIMERAKALGK